MGSHLLIEIDQLIDLVRNDLGDHDTGLSSAQSLEIAEKLTEATGIIQEILANAGDHLSSRPKRRWPLRWPPQNRRPRWSKDLAERRYYLQTILDELYRQVERNNYSSIAEGHASKLLAEAREILLECRYLARSALAEQLASPYTVLVHGGDTMLVRLGNIADAVNKSEPSIDEAPQQISVAMYIDGDAEGMDGLARIIDKLVDAIGYGEPLDEQVEKGSIFRRYKANLKQNISGRDAQAHITRTADVLDLVASDIDDYYPRGRIDVIVADLLESFRSVSNACVRVGPIIFVKYTTGVGPVVLVRTLTQLEVQVLERFPEIQREPEKVFGALALAVAHLADRDHDAK